MRANTDEPYTRLTDADELLELAEWLEALASATDEAYLHLKYTEQAALLRRIAAMSAIWHRWQKID